MLIHDGGELAKVERRDTRTKTSSEEKIEQFADDVGRLLGTARAKAESWLGQRQEIVNSLENIRDEASELLQQLGHEAAEVVRRRRGRPPGSTSKRSPGRPRKARTGRKGRGWSAEQRAAVAERMKKYWASRKK